MRYDFYPGPFCREQPAETAIVELKETYLQRLAGLLEPVPEAAQKLGISRQRVLQLIASHRLEAVKLGRDYFISSLSLQEYLDARLNKVPTRQ